MKVPVEAEVLNFLGAGVVHGFEPLDLSALEIHLNARLFHILESLYTAYSLLKQG